jgi:hypothetical protein
LVVTEATNGSWSKLPEPDGDTLRRGRRSAPVRLNRSAGRGERPRNGSDSPADKKETKMTTTIWVLTVVWYAGTSGPQICESAPNRDPADFYPIRLMNRAKLPYGWVPIGADRDPASDAHLRRNSMP